MKYLSLCIPTNGIEEWIFPVLDKIYEQDISAESWEVIVTNNGNNDKFHDEMIQYANKHENLIYKKTDAYMFENQIEALRLTTGEYLKFMNHRSILEPGAIQWMIDIVKDNIEDKPIIYMSNGSLKTGKRQVYGCFDEFVRGLREFASWTTGVGVWKSDFEKIPRDWKYNKISPHSDVLFWERNRGKYIIEDKVWAHDIDSSHKQKGSYDLYKAFAREEIMVTLNLLNDGDISPDTFKYIVKCYENCVVGFYIAFNIFHEECSYNLDGFDDAMGIFMNKRKVLIKAYSRVPKKIVYDLLKKK